MDDDVITMDGDVFFEEAILKRLIFAKEKNCVLIDRSSPNAGEEFMAGVNNAVISHISRGLRGNFDILGDAGSFGNE